MNQTRDNQKPRGERSISIMGPRARQLQCRRFVFYAILLSALFFAAHLLDFDRYVNVISGTSASGLWQIFCGMVYIALYIIVVGLVPILLIATALFEAAAILRGRFKDGNNSIP